MLKPKNYDSTLFPPSFPHPFSFLKCPLLTLYTLLSSMLQIRSASSFDWISSTTSLPVTGLTLLQSVLCIAARVFFLEYKLDYVTSSTEILQWLPTVLRMKSKLFTIASRSGSCLFSHISNHFPLHFYASAILIYFN